MVPNVEGSLADRLSHLGAPVVELPTDDDMMSITFLNLIMERLHLLPGPRENEPPVEIWVGEIIHNLKRPMLKFNSN